MVVNNVRLAAEKQREILETLLEHTRLNNVRANRDVSRSKTYAMIKEAIEQLEKIEKECEH